MARYRRGSLMEREELSRMLAAGANLWAIGQALGRAPSTLSRELMRQHASPVTYRKAENGPDTFISASFRPAELPRVRTGGII